MFNYEPPVPCIHQKLELHEACLLAEVLTYALAALDTHSDKEFNQAGQALRPFAKDLHRALEEAVPHASRQ